MTKYEGMSQAELIAALQAKDEAARKSATNKLSLKVTAPKLVNGVMSGTSGAISLYGMGRFPVTLYAEGWERLLDHAVVIRDFIETNRPLLSVKGERKAS
mgnify:CR=1 FL=1